MSRHVSLADLPPAYRAQAERQLSLSLARDLPEKTVAGSESASSGRETRRDASSSRSGRAPSRPRGPNKTEEGFLRTHLLPLYRDGQQIVYEGLTLHLPGGSRYTPDFVVFDTCEGFSVILYEVKGSYRLNSEGRAYTAFREARAAFPAFRFEWWKRKPGGGYERLHMNN